MEAKALQEDEELKMAALRRKRRRASSSSSYLEPAIANEMTHTASRICKESHSRGRNADAQHNERRQEISSSDVSDVSVSQTSFSPAKPVKTYERRSRHKTREDRYLLKDATAHVRAPKEKKRKKSTRLSRKEKTGSALLHNFVADNVASERLTLRPGTSLGLFSKGRASSPFRRGGLPDLSFSEVNFLSTRREKPTEPKRDLDNSKRRRERKTVDDDDEISRFFTVTKAPLTERDLNGYHNNGYAFPLPPVRSSNQNRHLYSTTTKSTMAPVEVPIRPFLGFGERGPHPPVSSGLSSSYRASTSPVKLLPRRSQSMTTSYFTWSTSPNDQNLSPHKRTVSDLFRSSPGKVDQEKSRAPESPFSRRAEHRKALRRHKNFQTNTADAGAAMSQRPLKNQDAEESVNVHVQDHPDPSTSSHNEGVIITELPDVIPKAQTLDFVETAQATDLADNHSLPVDTPVTNKYNHVEHISTEGQNPPSQFAIALQELLDQWKDKVEIPVIFANGLQQSCTTQGVGTNSAARLSTLQSVPPIADIQTESNPANDCQSTDDTRARNVLVPGPTTIVDGHCPDAPSKVIRPASTVSRGTLPKSQHSWADSRIIRDRVLAQSPFGDSTYSTCRGTESLYQQQLLRSAPFPHQELLSNRADEELGLANHLGEEYGRSQSFEPLGIPRHPQHANEHLTEQRDLSDSVSVHSLSRVLDDYSVSVEQGWPSQFEVQQDTTLGLGHGDYYGDYEYSASPSQVLEQPVLSPHFSNAMFRARSIRDCTEKIGYSISPIRPHQLNYESLGTESLQSGEVEEPPVGFWKPNRLY
ncbi:hypothetical protein MMC18_002175 [Xylographa bjoerkii]|nr:hypothetical protein [Xylographa bjoerkii]